MGRTGTGPPGGKKGNNKAIDRSMLLERFRPIAPKPVPPGSVAAAEKLPYVRTKRKYIKKKIKPINNNNRLIKEGGRKRDATSDFADDALLSPALVGVVGGSREEGSSTMWICPPEQPPPPPISIYPNKTADYPTVRNRNAGGGAPRRVVKSWLEVYGMKKTVPAGHIGLCGNSDREKLMNLEKDTCPVLISDCEQSVKYTNPAYKKMVDVGVEGGEAEEEEEEEEEEEGGRQLVWIVLKEKVPDTWTVFTCIGTVVYIWGKKKHTQTMPCDVWRLDFGGFVWRLDPQAALTLGR